MNEENFYQFSTLTVLILLAAFYGGTYLLTLLIKKKKENTDAFMVSNHQIGFGLGAASMTATWIWAASFYGAATSGYTYGISGPLHYGLWGALMILFIYPFGRRFRELAPNAHTLGELIHARHGSSSQLILASSNILGSIISLMVNFTASGALVSVLSPLSFQAGVVIAGVGVLSYTLWSGFRASVLTDFAQLMAMMAVAILIIPAVLFALGGPQTLSDGMSLLTPEQADLFSMDAILKQGAPFFVAVLAYAIGNQTISQRLFAVREDHIKPTFITATIGYGAIVIGLGMIGLMALMTGMKPIDGDMNNLIPQMVSMYLSPVFIGLFFILVIGSLSSTADSDLSAMSAIVMADVYGKNIAKNKPDPTKMLFIGRLTMIVATLIGVILASFSMDILIMLVFVGALWGAIVFPVIASCFWDRVTNLAFTSAVIAGLLMFCVARFELLPMAGFIAVLFELLAAVGGGVVLGLMTFGFCGRRVGLIVGALSAIGLAFLCVGFLRDYTVLLASLMAYGVSTLVCIAVSLLGSSKFDFTQIDQNVINYDPAKTEAQA
ncbi:sodium:solute symporter family protein [Pseudomonas neustonica]|uniref:Sodium:proline symporter n=1 Tax=Pseudomonas neustonica TaxID=2487346 RepID=A0ABX9XJN0_9PSED|nr:MULTISPECIES: sodium:solute symporter family protein [Pseudomonas]MBA6420034.1 sodium:solute symporter family protein [Pseudomonas sp. 5Ae-yellow]ROZ82243.1 sodium:proline symporter [Pseudomonas sp. SSM44]ROZ84025.1 sodium:proline symporter [Pseudomonas neustonica]|tara:strand:- start:471 stop:2123 length:1653 start_codon:yes stop_codon:yes gene_type:complete